MAGLKMNNEKFYIGMTPIAGIEVRIERHKTALINNNKEIFDELEK